MVGSELYELVAFYRLQLFIHALKVHCATLRETELLVQEIVVYRS